MSFMNILFSLPLLLVLATLDHAYADQEKMIYGLDNRKLMSELDAVNDSLAIQYSKSILAQIPNWRISSTNNENISIETKDLQAGLNFCDGEKFLNLPLVSACTAFLIGPDLIATAGHCIQDKFDCKKQTWVLDFDSAGDFQGPKGSISFSKDNTYSCAELLSQSENEKLDFALVRLNRKVEGRTPFKLRRTGKTSSNESLIVIGHPLGMPKMITDNIFVRDNSGAYSFKTNADTFSGNSGSPVIGLVSGLVEGVLVRGDIDFEMDTKSGCNRPTNCGDKECRGESVQRSTYLPFKYIPKI
jgi:hypothetical protein